MIENNINIGLDSIDKIFHFGDIHWRNFKRHEEYFTVFNRALEIVRKHKTPNSIIYLAGDIVHAKTDMSPELVEAVQKFFRMMADELPTILITGNHDCNLNNKNRLDALTPIVNALKHKRLYYLRDSGVYSIAGLKFIVMSVFDKPADYIKAKDVEDGYKIALYHGAVDSSTNDQGFRLTNSHVTVSLFEGYDLVLMGDIHKRQYLNDEKTIAYPGSTVQQNYAESLEHGFLEWDVKTKTSVFHKVPNDIAFVTIEVDKGNYTLPKELPNNIRLKLKVTDTDTSVIKQIVTDISQDYNVLEVVTQKNNTNYVKNPQTGKINIGDVDDVEYQNTLISNYLTSKYNLDDTILDGIRHINRNINSSLPKKESTRNVVWIPKRFEFSNMFSYGPNNVIDFTNFKGTYGIFAPNASGKSTLFEALLFCVFDKCNRTSKAAHVLNNQSSNFSCKFHFELDGQDYWIERKGTTIRENVKVDVDFYTLDENGDIKSLNGGERSETNDAIRKILGTYEDFILTSMSVQNNNTGFIDMAQRERKDLLAQFLNIDVFENLYKIANEESKDLTVLIKEAKKKDYNVEIQSSYKEIKILKTNLLSEESTKTDIEKEVNDLNSSIQTLSSQLVSIDSSISDIKTLKDTKEAYVNKITEITNKCVATSGSIDSAQTDIAALKTTINGYDSNKISKGLEQLDIVMADLDTIELDLEKYKVEVKHKLLKMEKLDQLEYDENCQFCMNNVFVQDAIETKKNLESDKEKVTDLINKKKQLETQKESLSNYSTLNAELEAVTSKYDKLQLKLSQLQTEYHKLETALQTTNTALQNVESKITAYYQQETDIVNNQKINSQISKYKSELSDKKEELEETLNTIKDLYSEIKIHEQKITSANESIEKLKQLESQYSYYKYYLDATNRDGVPYDLIATSLPILEQEINNILAQIVEFRIVLNTDGKNINSYITYDSDNFWPIELTSGMERFISSLAIRSSLISLSSLPRPNFLVIDEGFGALDSDNMNNIYTLFDYLKSQFTFIMIISHIDSMRDIVDNIVDIVKVKNKSNINYV